MQQQALILSNAWSKICAIGALLVVTLGCADSLSTGQENSLNWVFPLARGGQIVSHTFRITNDTNVEKRVVELKSSCGCTVSKIIEGTIIAPGTELSVPIEMNLAGKEGQVSSTVEVWMSGRSEPIVLTISGMVHADSPAIIDFGNVKRGGDISRSFKLRGFPEQPKLALLSIASKEDWIKVQAKAADDNSFDVLVSLSPSIPYGTFDIPLKIHTNDGEIPVKRTNVKGRVLGRLEISEKSVYFGALKAGETLTKDVKLSTPYGESLTFLSVDNSKQEVFATQVAAPTQSDTLPVTITTTGIIPAGTPAGVVKGTLLFHTRVGESEETARVEVYGMIE